MCIAVITVVNKDIDMVAIMFHLISVLVTIVYSYHFSGLFIKKAAIVNTSFFPELEQLYGLIMKTSYPMSVSYQRKLVNHTHLFLNNNGVVDL